VFDIKRNVLLVARYTPFVSASLCEVNDTKRRMVNRWLSFSASLFVQLCAGTAYAFSLYSNHLRDTLGWNQKEVEHVGSIGNIGMYLGIFAGIFYDRYGPQTTGVVGAAISGLGYTLIYLFTTGFFQSTEPWLGAVLFAAAWHGSAWLDTSAIANVCKNFPEDKGLALGLMKSFFGLSASLVAVVNTWLFYQTEDSRGGGHGGQSFCKNGHVVATNSSALRALQRGPDVAGTKPSGGNGVPLMLFLSIFIFSFGSLSSLLTKESDRKVSIRQEKNGTRRMMIGYFAVTCLAFYLGMTSLLLPKSTLFERSARAFGAGVLLLPLLFLSCGSSKDENDTTWFSVSSDGGNGDTDNLARASLLEDRTVQMKRQTAGLHMTSRGEYTLLEALKTMEFYLLLVAQLFATGSGLMVINNIAQIEISLDGSPSSAVSFVTIIGVSNCLGRMIGGYCSEIFKAQVPRPLAYAIAMLVMLTAQLVLGFAQKGALLYVGSVMAGMSYGSFWAITPALVAELWGNQAFGSIYQSLNIAPAVGGFLFSATLAGGIYDKHANNKEGHLCCGKVCYFETHMVSASCLAIGIVLVLILYKRTRGFYMVLRDH
jgi:MFS family permease